MEATVVVTLFGFLDAEAKKDTPVDCGQ